MADAMAPELASPMVAYLAHERCDATGRIYTAGAGRFGRLAITSTSGHVHGGSSPTPEDVADHWAEINDLTGATEPADLTEWSTDFLSHLDLDVQP